MATKTAKSTPGRVTSPTSAEAASERRAFLIDSLTGPEIEALAKADQAFHDVVRGAVGQISTSTAAGQDCLYVSGPTGIRLPPTPAVATKSSRERFEDEQWYRERLDWHFALMGETEKWDRYTSVATLDNLKNQWDLLSRDEQTRANDAVRGYRRPARARQRNGSSSARSRDPILEDLRKEIRTWKDSELTQLEMCDRLDANKHSGPKLAKWSNLTWRKAFMDPKYSGSVKKWLSKAANS